MMAVLTKAQQVEKYLRGGIVSGRWAVGERLPGENQILSRLRVSRSTLREALASLSAEGLIYAKHGSGTYVKRMPATRAVAIVAEVDRLSSPMGYFHRGLVDRARKRIEGSGRGYRAVIMVGQGESPDEFMSSINLLDGNNIKDIVGVLVTLDMGPLEESLAEVGVPSVTIEPAVASSNYSVVLDYDTLVDQAINLLKSHGHHEFALMYTEGIESRRPGGGRQVLDYARRLQTEAVGGRDDLLVHVPWTMDYSHVCEVFKEWWSRPKRPNAMFFYDDALFDAASRAILEMGIKVPRDLAIVTHANIGRRFEFPVPVTSIGYDPEEAVDIAWDLLEKLVADQPISEQVVRVAPHVCNGSSLG